MSACSGIQSPPSTWPPQRVPFFIREIISERPRLMEQECGETVRHQMVFTPNLELLYNIVPEAILYLGNRSIIDIAGSTV